MIASEGYVIMQEVKNNRLVIMLPQTNETLTSTTVPIGGRRLTITAEEEAAILNIVKAMYENKLVPT